MENFKFSLKSSGFSDLSPWIGNAMELMSPDVCSLVLMQARARSDKQGVTWISKREELFLLWLARRYVWQMNYTWTWTGRYNKQKSTWLTFFKPFCRYKVIQNANQMPDFKKSNDCKVDSHMKKPALLWS